VELLLEALARELDRSGVNLSSWLLGAARLLPSVILIPVLGLRALPTVARLVAALALATSTAPALAGLDAGGEPWLATLLSEIAVGLPLAIGAASTLWVASMGGNLLDQLAQQPHRPRAFDMADATLSPFGVLLSLGAAVAFFTLGGPARLVAALAAAPAPSEATVRDVVLGLLQGIHVAVLLAAPLLVLVAFFELLQGLWLRLWTPLGTAHWLGPARFVVLIAVAALLLDRFFEALALWMTSRLPAG
jgi:type III secretory pathway component EscT